MASARRAGFEDVAKLVDKVSEQAEEVEGESHEQTE